MRVDDVDVVQLHALQRRARALDDVLAGQALAVVAILRAEEDLGRQHQLLARPNAVLDAHLNCLAHDCLAPALCVCLSVVEEIYAPLERHLHELVRLLSLNLVREADPCCGMNEVEVWQGDTM